MTTARPSSRFMILIMTFLKLFYTNLRMDLSAMTPIRWICFSTIQYLTVTLIFVIASLILHPDMNHFNYIGNCELSTVDELNERFFANLSFSVLHLNARSLVKNHKDLSHLLANINHKFSMLAITETWIKDDEPYDLNFDGYNFISNHCSGRTGGGVSLYIDEKLTYKVLTV